MKIRETCDRNGSGTVVLFCDEAQLLANQSFIPNYGNRYRHDETISMVFVESTVNYVVSKRFVKKQQMRWTQRGAHLLLLTRVQVLNDDLRTTFVRWFSGTKLEEQAALKQAA